MNNDLINDNKNNDNGLLNIKEVVHNWLDIQDEIKKLDAEIKLYNLKKKETLDQKKKLLSAQKAIQPMIIQYMNQIDTEALDLGRSKIKYEYKDKLLTLTKDRIKERLSEFFSTQPEIVQPLYDYIIDPNARKTEGDEKLIFKEKKTK
jgi:uncharacterized protein (DUF3084 family)